MTVDAANLALAKEQGLLRSLSSPTLEKAVPENLRDPEGRWFSLSVRARAVVYNKDKVKPADITTYEALKDERWRGRLCLRTSTSAYTQSLVASFVAKDGVQGAQRIVDGWVANSPQVLANDVEILRTLAAGGCDVGITNHYYLARELAKDPKMPVGLAWPNQRSTGTHVNVSGAGVTTHAKYPAEAQRFLEWMATTGQPMFVEGNFEFPVNPEVELHPILKAFGPYRRDELNVGELGQHNAQAVQVLTDAGYR
jgi:iron(III) transport system substrate-binding protein